VLSTKRLRAGNKLPEGLTRMPSGCIRFIDGLCSEPCSRFSESVVPCGARVFTSDDTFAQIVGVSKRCCYLCHRLLSSMQVQHTGTHGKIYSWIPPPGIPADKLRGLLDDLQICLAETLNSTQRRRQSLESFASSASEVLSSEEEQDATASPLQPIDLFYPLKSGP
jgi:hypothetical protein